MERDTAWDRCLLLFGVYFAARIGFLWIGHFIFLVRCHFSNWIRRIDLVEKYGSWAVITGATSGIGLGLAKILASQGMNVVLVSRSRNKLETVAKEIERQYGVETKIVVSEATNRQSYKYVCDVLAGMDIGILVNNVATISEEGRKPLCFHETRSERVLDMNTVNCGAATLLTRAALPRMMTKNKGLILNMSSIAAYYPISYQAHYSATKIYLEMLGDSIREEIKDSGVKMKAVRPFIVQTQMTATNDICYNFPLAQSSDTFSRHVLPTLVNDTNTCGYWFTDFTMWTFTLWPDWYRYCLVTLTMRYGDKHGKVVSSLQK